MRITPARPRRRVRCCRRSTASPRLIAQLFSTDIPWRAGSLAAAVHVHPSAPTGVTARPRHRARRLTAVAVGWRAVVLAAAPTDDSLRVVLRTRAAGDCCHRPATSRDAPGEPSKAARQLFGGLGVRPDVGEPVRAQPQVCVLRTAGIRRCGRDYGPVGGRRDILSTPRPSRPKTTTRRRGRGPRGAATAHRAELSTARLPATQQSPLSCCLSRPTMPSSCWRAVAPPRGGISFGVVLCGESCTADRHGRCQCEGVKVRAWGATAVAVTNVTTRSTERCHRCSTHSTSLTVAQAARGIYSWSDVSSPTYDARSARAVPFSPSGPATWLRMSNRRRPRAVSVEVATPAQRRVPRRWRSSADRARRAARVRRWRSRAAGQAAPPSTRWSSSSARTTGSSCAAPPTRTHRRSR